MNYLIDGIDRLGKSTLIENIQQECGYYSVVHLGKPKALKVYGGNLERYQLMLFHDMFRQLSSRDRMIFDRTHLGEMVYAPMYRGYHGNYVFDLEKNVDLNHTRLILLTEDFSKSKHFSDDGLSFDITKRKEEQERFTDAYYMSSIKDKLIVNVTADDGNYRSKQDILADVLV